MKKKVISLFKSIAISSLLSFVVFLLANTFIRALFEDSERINLILSSFNMIVYGICYYIVRIKDQDNFGESDSSKNDLYNEIKAYFVAEGRYLIGLYAILAVLCEINCLISQGSSGILLVTLCSMFFPLFAYINIPVVRMVLSLIITIIVHIALIVIRYFNINKKTRR